MAKIFPSRKFLVNGSSTNLAVNGSVTPVQFTYTPAAGEIFSAHELIFQATGTGTIAQPLTEFWDFPALTNGISTETKLNNNLLTLTGIIKTNFDLIQYIGAEFLGKIIGTRNVVRGNIALIPPMNLNGTLGDYYRITINDNMLVGSKIEIITICLRGNLITL